MAVRTKAFNVIGKVYHDVTNEYHARKAADAGVDGLIAVCSGAGGHAGVTSPFALIPQIRSFYKGTVICSGSISCGFGIRSAIALGADYAYLGTRFITTKESLASDSYKEMIVDAKSGKASEFPIQYTDKVSGIPANFIKKSLIENNVKFEETSGDVPVEDMSDPATAKVLLDLWFLTKHLRLGRIFSLRGTAS
jgi:nitronate monooxygenase